MTKYNCEDGCYGTGYPSLWTLGCHLVSYPRHGVITDQERSLVRWHECKCGWRTGGVMFGDVEGTKAAYEELANHFIENNFRCPAKSRCQHELSQL